MRLPLLLPTQTLQLLPPASMDTQGKKSVLLTTIKVCKKKLDILSFHYQII